MSTFLLEIVTPEHKFYSGEIESLIIDTPDGKMGILNGHVPIVVPLPMGEIVLKIGGANRYAVCSGGFMEMLGHKAYLFVQSIEWIEDINIVRAQEALERAKRKLQQADNVYDRQRFLWALERAEARLNAVSKIKNKDAKK